jgi:hypothetical protein
MARARNIKPGFFTDAELVDCEIWVRMLFAGLWTLADREGRLLDKPKQIGLDLFPRDRLDIDAGLNELAEHGLIVRYAVNGVQILQVKNFAKHQNPHKDERASILPPQEIEDDFTAPTVEAPGFMPENTVQNAIKPSSLRADSPIPDSQPLIPDTGYHDTPQTPRKRGAVVDTPYAMWAAFCEAAEYDIGAATPQEKGRSLKTAKRLMEGGVSAQEVAACTRYLMSQTWRTSVLSLAGVANEIGKWRMAGSPAAEKARASPAPKKSGGFFAAGQSIDEEQGHERQRNRHGAGDDYGALLADPKDGRAQRGVDGADVAENASGRAITAAYRTRPG